MIKSYIYVCQREWKLKNKKVLLSIIISSLLFAFVLIVDIVTKYIMFKVLPSKGSSMSFIPGFINFIHVENTGVAWGALAGRPVFLIILAITILSLYLTFFILKLKNNNKDPNKHSFQLFYETINNVYNHY